MDKEECYLKEIELIKTGVRSLFKFIGIEQYINGIEKLFENARDLAWKDYNK